MTYGQTDSDRCSILVGTGECAFDPLARKVGATRAASVSQRVHHNAPISSGFPVSTGKQPETPEPAPRKSLHSHHFPGRFPDREREFVGASTGIENSEPGNRAKSSITPRKLPAGRQYGNCHIGKQQKIC
jgi:hypothetical protein